MSMMALGQRSASGAHELTRLMCDLRRWCPGEFRGMELMYSSSSRDGMNAKVFHSKCGDGSCSTITVVKCSRPINGSVPPTFGGFFTVSWAARSDGACDFMHSAEAFLFAMKDNKGLVKYDLREGHATCAIYCAPTLGPCFGADNMHLSFSNDQYFDATVATGNHSYEVPDGSAFLSG